MIDLNNIPPLNSWLLDVILILISASACFYCALLSRRLKALNRLDSGVGASIVSLTEAIGKTHEAARDAQNSTLETVKTLRYLLEKSESMGPVLEASMTEVSRSIASVQKLKAELDITVQEDLSEATLRARKVATNLLKTVATLEARYLVEEIERAEAAQEEDTEASVVENNIEELKLARASKADAKMKVAI
jgi:hypothetical protein